MPQCWGLPIKQSGVFPSFAPCLEHVCAGGGSVAIEGFVVYIGGDISCTLNITLLVQVMAYVMSDMFAIDIVGH